MARESAANGKSEGAREETREAESVGASAETESAGARAEKESDGASAEIDRGNIRETESEGNDILMKNMPNTSLILIEFHYSILPVPDMYISLLPPTGPGVKKIGPQQS